MTKEIIKQNIVKEDWYQGLVTDLQQLRYKETANLITSKWKIGDRINKEIEKGHSFRSFVPHVEQDIGISQTEQWYCWQLRRTYPKLTEEIKQTSWRKLSRGLEPPNKKDGSEYKTFDVWNFQGCDERYGDPSFPGRIPGQLIKNLLYYFTKQGDLVVDPMAGGGTTIDVCKEMKRKCLAYDIDPIRDDIIKNDLREGLPKETKDCNLIFLDPPYWKKKQNDYTKNSISNLSKEEYIKFFKSSIPFLWAALSPRGTLAFLMSNYIDYENPKESIFVADYFQLFRQADFIPLYEIQCPLSTQQYQAHDIERAREKKKLLIISRSLFIYGKI